MNIHELEAQFLEIDERSELESVDASLAGNTESSGSLVVSAGGKGIAESAEAVDLGAAQPEILLNINLSEVNVPDEYIDNAIATIFSNQDVGILPGIKVMQIGATQDYVVVEDYPYHADAGYVANSTWKCNRTFFEKYFVRSSIAKGLAGTGV